jgi:hypothetical protein
VSISDGSPESATRRSDGRAVDPNPSPSGGWLLGSGKLAAAWEDAGAALATPAKGPRRQGLTLVHIRAQLEQLQDTFIRELLWVIRLTEELKLS